MEQWKKIEGFENYSVSNNGRVRNDKTGRILKTYKKPSGYIQVQMGRKTVPKYIHRLVAQEFIPNASNKPQINHKNGIKDDNRLFNLEYCTNSENQIHALENNLTKIRKRRYKFNKQDSRKCLDKYRAIAIEKAIKKISKPILELDKNNNIIKRFNSCKEAERYYNKRIHLENNKRFIKESEYYGM